MREIVVREEKPSVRFYSKQQPITSRWSHALPRSATQASYRSQRHPMCPSYHTILLQSAASTLVVGSWPRSRTALCTISATFHPYHNPCTASRDTSKSASGLCRTRAQKPPSANLESPLYRFARTLQALPVPEATSRACSAQQHLLLNTLRLVSVLLLCFTGHNGDAVSILVSVNLFIQQKGSEGYTAWEAEYDAHRDREKKNRSISCISLSCPGHVVIVGQSFEGQQSHDLSCLRFYWTNPIHRNDNRYSAPGADVRDSASASATTASIEGTGILTFQIRGITTRASPRSSCTTETKPPRHTATQAKHMILKSIRCRANEDPAQPKKA